MRQWLLSGLIVGSALAFLPAAALAAPANDAFSAAIPLAAGEEISSSNLEATSQPGEPNPKGFAAGSFCASVSTRPECGTSVWYTFQSASGGEYTIETCDGGTDLLGLLGVYDGISVGGLTALAEGGPNPNCPTFEGTGIGSGSQVTFTAIAGTTYHVDLIGYGAAEGSFYLRAYSGPGKTRPHPDTRIRSGNSFTNARDTFFSAPGVLSGPRHSASFSFVSNGAATGFECSMDGAAFAVCASPVSYDELAPGTSHAFRVRATLGGVPDPSPALERFSIDATPPNTTIASGPTGDTASQTAMWTAASSERFNRAYIMCGIDAMPLRSCGGPVATTFVSLCQGPHAFHAAGIDNAANVDPSPAIAQINETSGPACGPPSVGTAKNFTPSATFANATYPYEDTGAGGYLHVEYGPSTAYGLETPDRAIDPQVGGEEKLDLSRLTPNTLYHFRVTITTPFGTASTPDQTFTTLPAVGGVPTIANGTPVVAGEHAARVPVTIDPQGKEVSYRMMLTATNPEKGAGTILGFLDNTIPAGPPQAGAVEVVDLDPSTTYHYRFIAQQAEGGNGAIGPEGTFATPPYPPAKSHFKLRRGLIKVSRLTPRSRVLTFRLHGLPAGTIVGVQLKAGKKRTRKSGKVKAAKLTLKVRLTRKFRDALLGKGKLSANVTAAPPGDTTSGVTFPVKLHKPHKRHGSKHH